MQPTEGISTPRRALDVEDYIDIVRRHRSWIFGPFLFTLVVAVVVAYMWPDTYVSQGVIKIVPQQVPENMVQAAVNQEMSDRIIAMEQNIESRSSLTSIITTFGLYPKERAKMTMEDVIEQVMKRAITITPVVSMGGSGHQVPAFIVEFSYENRHLAQKVVEDLVGKFIAENARNRSDATFETTQFLKDETDQARKVLDDTENKLTTFRVQNNGRLPDQVDANRQQLMTIQNNAAYLTNGVSRADSELYKLESDLAIFQDRVAQLNKPPDEAAAPPPQKGAKLLEAERTVDNLENVVRQLKQVYQPTFTDVQLAQAQLDNAIKQRDQLAKEEADARKATPVTRSSNPQLEQAKLELGETIRRQQNAIQQKKLEIDGYNKDLKHWNEEMNKAQARMETIPLGQKESDDLIRDRDMAKIQYEEKAAKLSKAQTAQEMEGRNQGETLAILDPASLPQNPSEPKRGMWVSVGAGIGLLLGIVIAGAREMKDTSLKNLKDVRAYTQLAILGSIPLLENDFVVRRRKRLAWLGWTTACLAAAVVMSGSLVYYFATKQ